MNDDNWLLARFEGDRDRLRSVAFRMLGSAPEADDAVQEVWIRLNRSDTSSIENLGGWLTTVVARVCLDMLRSRRTRREDPLDDAGGGPLQHGVTAGGPEEEVVLADSVGPALLVVLDTLTPAERLAFVLHDMFGIGFEEIAPIVRRSPAATRQLASRGRRRVRGGAVASERDAARERSVVEAFLAASRGGDLRGLIAVLDPDVVMRADATAVKVGEANRERGAPPFAEAIHGAESVAEAFVGRASGAQLAMIDGAPGATWAPGGTPRAVFAFTVEGDRIVEMEIVLDRDHIREMALELID